MAEKKKICIVGSGNWGSVIAKIIGNNVRENSKFDSRVTMYVFEEMINGQKLTDIINTKHENVKYLPGVTLPDNVIAEPDVVAAAKDADFLVFVLPHQFIRNVLRLMKGQVKKSATGVSLAKSFFATEGATAEGGLDISDKGLKLISEVIKEELGISCAVLMGANIAPEVAKEHFCEATIGCNDPEQGQLLKDIMQTSYFRIVVVNDAPTVELCGALKNIVATGAGFIDGLGLGNNTKAAVIRLGLMEMVKFCKMYSSESRIDTFLESCGIADLVTTSYSGRNKRVAEAFVKTGKSIETLEAEMLNGQKLQGPPTAAEIYTILKAKNMIDSFPLFVAIHRICTGELTPSAFIDCLRNHPEHM